MGPLQMTHRVVLDTNVVLSALLFQSGRLSWLRQAWKSEACRPLASQKTVAELLRALSYPKFRLEPEDVEELLGDYLPFVEVINPSSSPESLPMCSDPDDHMFLELAAAGRADLLITGDKALLSLDAEVGFRIVTPAAARSLLAGRSGQSE
jgi:uncharacterized protein